VAIAEEHFIGLDARGRVPLRLGCPLNTGCAFVVWFESYGFTFWQIGLLRNTGIGYLRSYVAFDICGQQQRTLEGCGFETFGFGGNYTAGPFDDVVPFDIWLARARKEAERRVIPNPGTVQFTDRFHQIIGYRG